MPNSSKRYSVSYQLDTKYWISVFVLKETIVFKHPVKEQAVNGLIYYIKHFDYDTAVFKHPIKNKLNFTQKF